MRVPHISETLKQDSKRSTTGGTCTNCWYNW